jgi:L-amino acid N-acyltransferase YncA
LAINFTIEEAKVTDLDQVREIYSYYVTKLLPRWKKKLLTQDEMVDLYSFVLSKNLPFIVAKSEGKVLDIVMPSLIESAAPIGLRWKNLSTSTKIT